MFNKWNSFWKNASKGKKSAVIISIVFWVLALIAVILLIFAKDIFGPGSYLASILADKDGNTFDLGAWFIANADKFIKSIFYLVVILGASKLLRWLLGLIFTKSKKAITIKLLS